MPADHLTPKLKEAYEKITEYLKTTNTTNVSKASEALGINSSYYYTARKYLKQSNRKKPGPKPKMVSFAVPEVSTARGLLTMIRGTPEELAELMRLMR